MSFARSILPLMLMSVLSSCDNRMDLGAGYMASDTDQDQIYISKNGVIVIDPAVAGTFSNGTDLYIAQQPVITDSVSQGVRFKLTNVCRYWIIDKKYGKVSGPFNKLGFYKYLRAKRMYKSPNFEPIGDGSPRLCLSE